MLEGTSTEKAIREEEHGWEEVSHVMEKLLFKLT